MLHAFVDAGFDAIDTADSYSTWVPGNQGGEAETIIGRWLRRDPSRRDRVHVLTKVGSEMGASNHDASQLAEALRVADANGLPRYATLQPEYNLYDRARYEGPLRDLAIREGLGVVPYFGLASGFLTGKYRSRDDLGRSPRGSGVAKYLDDRGLRILAALDDVGGRRSAQPAEVALAWLMQREGVTAPIASATSREQLASLVHAAELRRTAEDVATLDAASA